MTKSLLAGIAACTALAVFAGNANAYKARPHRTYNTTTTSSTGTHRASVPTGTRVTTSPTGSDPIYESCEYPWRHLEVGCPYGR